ncbi:MAG: hypothetical protein ACREYE_21570 [Gammaproteobacteria bacterium]
MKTSTAVAAVAALLFSPAIASADVVLDWNAIMLTALNGQPPPFKNRFAAIRSPGVIRSGQRCHGRLQAISRHDHRVARCIR